MGFTLKTGAIVEKKRLVKMSGATVVHNTATSTDDPIGVSDYYGASGDVISITSLNEDELIEVTVSGTCSAGVPLYAAADGKVTAYTSGTLRRVAMSFEAATADGDIIKAIAMNDGTTRAA